MRHWNRKAACIVAVLGVTLAVAPALASNANTDTTTTTPTFYKDVLPLLQQNCQTCHRPSGLNLGGMIAPMPLVTYNDSRPWAKSIAKSVENREMPPWHAAPQYHGVFLNERSLDDAQIATIVSWAKAGAPAGSEADAPPPLEWPSSEWSLGQPDLVLKLAEPFHVKDDLRDLNINLPAQEVLIDEDKYITAIEYKPDTTAVHHIIGFAVLPNETGDGPGGMQMLSGIAPGSDPSDFPAGYGILLPKGSKIIFQMHYHKEPGPGTEVWDQSSVAMKFADKPVQRLYVSAVGDRSKMYLPANAKDVRITSEERFDKSITLMGLLPHMHYRGDYSLYVAKLPDGTEKEFLEVPSYDFNWQTRYKFREHLVLPAGTTVAVTMGYDNTADNPNNPDPNAEVGWGDSTDDEMNLGFMYWAYTNPADDDGGPTRFRRRPAQQPSETSGE
jgi:mono/diheme cytochrome c family protein